MTSGTETRRVGPQEWPRGHSSAFRGSRALLSAKRKIRVKICRFGPLQSPVIRSQSAEVGSKLDHLSWWRSLVFEAPRDLRKKQRSLYDHPDLEAQGGDREREQ